jgi:hypothetical protein
VTVCGERILWKDLRNSNIVIFVLLLGVAAVCYLPLAHRFGFYRDDWYLIYSIVSQGTEKLSEVFAVDRPFRAPFVSFFFNLLGLNAPLYSYTGFIARIIGALSLYWIIRMVWPKATKAAWAATLLFVAYPGFLDMPTAFDFQSHFWAFALGILSIALSVRAALGGNKIVRGVTITLAAIFQLTNLLLMEYFIGIEGLRVFLLVYIFMRPSLPASHFRQWLSLQTLRNVLRGLAWSGPALLVSAGFLIWRQFFFQNQRGATDIGRMLSGILESPWLSLLWAPVNMARDLLNVIVFAWAVPVYELAFQLRLRDSLFVIGMGVLAAFLVWLIWQLRASEKQLQPEVEIQDGWGMVWVGLASAVVALLPAHLGDRQVIFQDFSRFAWPPSAGAALLLAGLWMLALHNRFRQLSLMLLIAIAAITHNANSLSYVNYTKILNSFWWQVSWRIPQIEGGTVLAANYAGQGAQEDYFVWGPANLIYYPDLAFTEGNILALSALTFNHSDVYAVLAGEKILQERRATLSLKDSANLLVLSMPTPYSCVHVLDGQHPELSEQEHLAISLLAPSSRPERILLAVTPHTPPELVFGAEPSKGWCYYYQKADLARQRGDWVEVGRLGDEVLKNNLRPSEWVEWMPFVYAYAALQREAEFERGAFVIRDNPFLREQACRHVLLDTDYAEQFPQGQLWMQDMFCW